MESDDPQIIEDKRVEKCWDFDLLASGALWSIEPFQGKDQDN